MLLDEIEAKAVEGMIVRWVKVTIMVTITATATATARQCTCTKEYSDNDNIALVCRGLI
jgi:hypothetical protein